MADAVERVAWFYLLNKARERRRLAPLRRVWIHQTFQRRSEFGEFHHLLQELRAEEDCFQRYFRLSPAQFDNLLGSLWSFRHMIKYITTSEIHHYVSDWLMRRVNLQKFRFPNSSVGRFRCA
ncbi:hypothetical protein XENORESO_016667 [Xenotaenia resolanae]|uniref:Uncharacterized protein n=1 Tax=Xenotaenia resolanae TaxID=208358 RepID=A0ABV0VSQ9_9TELE